jgi:DNA-binding MarR family transcriptional regulator
VKPPTSDASGRTVNWQLMHRLHDINPPMDAPHFNGSTDPVGEVIDVATDLTVRHLATRNGLSTTASLLVNRLTREGPARLTALAAAEGISQPAMTQLIQRLERQGFVARLSDPEDGRVALVAVTEAGRRLLDQRAGERRERLTELLATLSPEAESALRLAAHVALPILRQLLDNATDAASSGSARLQ